MKAAIRHRGPDDQGFYAAPGAALGFRRLSILDLQYGHQPMLTPDDSCALVFNGEIYNHQSLRPALEKRGVRFKTHADSETLLHLLKAEGAAALPKLSGMYAFGFFDARAKTIILARDHAGIKPLYYAVRGGELLFASELRALLSAGVEPELDPEGTAEYLQYGFVHAPRTIVKNVWKLPPAHYLELKQGEAFTGPGPLKRHYAAPISDTALENLPEQELLERIDLTLNESVKSHLLSDVPVGVFLSGGVDSSLMAALMAKHFSGKIKTFSIGFSGQSALDESAYAKQMAAKLGTEHHPLVLDGGVLAKIPELLCALDEPLGDSAVLPTLLLSRHAAKEVKVALSGEGADELFAGYRRYKPAMLSWQIMRLNPRWRGPATAIARRMGSGHHYKSIPVLTQAQWAEAGLQSSDSAVSALLQKPQHQDSSWLSYIEQAEGFNSLLAFDLRTVMAEALLMKVDKASMQASIESRVPFLSPEMIALGLTLPPSVKQRRFKGKWILRKLSEKYIPHNLAWRRKHGFVGPWERWIESNPAEVLAALQSPALKKQELLDGNALAAGLKNLSEGSKAEDKGLLYRASLLALWLDAASR